MSCASILQWLQGAHLMDTIAPVRRSMSRCALVTAPTTLATLLSPPEPSCGTGSFRSFRGGRHPTGGVNVGHVATSSPMTASRRWLSAARRRSGREVWRRLCASPVASGGGECSAAAAPSGGAQTPCEMRCSSILICAGAQSVARNLGTVALVKFGNRKRSETALRCPVQCIALRESVTFPCGSTGQDWYDKH